SATRERLPLWYKSNGRTAICALDVVTRISFRPAPSGSRANNAENTGEKRISPAHAKKLSWKPGSKTKRYGFHRSISVQTKTSARSGRYMRPLKLPEMEISAMRAALRDADANPVITAKKSATRPPTPKRTYRGALSNSPNSAVITTLML